MKLASVRKSGRLCGAVTAVVATMTAVASVTWVAQTAVAVQSGPNVRSQTAGQVEPVLRWVSPPPAKVPGGHTFIVSAGTGVSLSWTGRGAVCRATTASTAECRVRERSRAGTLTFTATGPAGRTLRATTRVTPWGTQVTP